MIHPCLFDLFTITFTQSIKSLPGNMYRSSD